KYIGKLVVGRELVVQLRHKRLIRRDLNRFGGTLKRGDLFVGLLLDTRIDDVELDRGARLRRRRIGGCERIEQGRARCRNSQVRSLCDYSSPCSRWRREVDDMGKP